MLVALLVPTDGCQSRAFEEEFFKTLADRVERSRSLPLEQQYRLFRYAKDVIHPPLTDMAIPIAERGPSAVPFLLQQLETDRSDLGARDIVFIFSRMALLKAYDVASDEKVLATLTARVAKMKDRGWHDITSKMLKDIQKRDLILD